MVLTVYDTHFCLPRGTISRAIDLIGETAGMETCLCLLK